MAITEASSAAREGKQEQADKCKEGLSVSRRFRSVREEKQSMADCT